jgi:hypothetical protein
MDQVSYGVSTVKYKQRMLCFSSEMSEHLYFHFVVISVADPDHFGKLHPDPHQSRKLDPAPHQSEKQDPNRVKVKRWKP